MVLRVKGATCSRPKSFRTASRHASVGYAPAEAWVADCSEDVVANGSAVLIAGRELWIA